MKSIFIGCVEMSYVLLERLLKMDSIKLAGVVTRKASDFNADFRSLEPLADGVGAPCLNITGNDQEEMTAWIADIGPDVVFCFGWSWLLGAKILAIPRQGVIGYHPAMLPRNRGRHPIVWALVKGLEETGSTFFIMDEGADSGDIVSQRRVPISGSDDAASLYAKLQDAAGEQLEEIVGGLTGGTLPRHPQNPDDATVWRKRGKKDGEIDWTMPADGIYNLVRALTRPYVGAHCIYNGHEFKVWKAAPVTFKSVDAEPGKVLSVEGGTLTVQCGKGVLNLTDHDMTDLPTIGDTL